MAGDSPNTAWLTQIRKGDETAVSKLLAAQYPVLKARTVERMDPALRARCEPEDILQQVFLEVFRAVHTFEERGPDSFFNWVLTILDHKLTDARRALHRQVRDIARERPAAFAADTRSYVDLLDRLYVDTRTPSRAVREDEAVGALVACMASLSDSHQRVLRLRFLEGLSVAEVADHMCRTPAAIVALTTRALAALRESMARLGEFTRGG